jgi:hypothetical protein
VSDNLQSSAFDHKAVILKLSGSGTDYGKQNSSCWTISDPDADLLVNLSVLECHLIYQDRGVEDKNRLLSLIGARRKDLRDAGPDPVFYNIENVFLQDENIRNNLIGNVRNFVNVEISRNILNFDLNIEDDVFFEILLNHVKVDLTSYQIFIAISLGREKKRLRSELAALNNFTENFQEIAAVFEHINGEKMSPHFLKLAKGCKTTDSIFQVKDDNGENHENISACKEFVTCSGPRRK